MNPLRASGVFRLSPAVRASGLPCFIVDRRSGSDNLGDAVVGDRSWLGEWRRLAHEALEMASDSDTTARVACGVRDTSAVAKSAPSSGTERTILNPGQ